MKKNIEKIFRKGNYTKVKLIVSILIAIIVAYAIDIKWEESIVLDRIVIRSLLIIFALLHAIIPLNKMYDFIYRKRYIIALVIFVCCVIMGYSGSSISTYRHYIQPEEQNTEYLPIIGEERAIRSDEWNVNTPIAVSQDVGENKYSYYNDKLRGTNTDIISLIGAPAIDITLLGKPFNIGYILLGPEKGLSFYWCGKVIAIMLASFEFFMLITNKKKLVSLLGMILVVFSASTKWWNITDIIIWGFLALVLFDKFQLTKKISVKIACGVGIGISALSYIFILYPAWQISFAYVYLAVLIWIIWKNRKEYKLNFKDILIILLVILMIVGVLVHYYINSKETLEIVTHTSYPGARFELGGGAKNIIFSYVYSMWFPYSEMANPCELSSMLSLFPIPMIVAFIYMIRNRKKEEFSFLIPMLIVSLVFTVWCLIGTNEIFAKFTFLYMCQGTRVAIPLGLTQIILMVYVMGHCNKEDKIVSKSSATFMAIILSIIILSIAIKTDSQKVMGNLRAYISGVIVLSSTYLLFTINKEKNIEKLTAILIPVALLTGITVNPIQKGLKVLYEKPIAKEVQKIVKEDPNNNLWLIGSVPNYYLASGAKVINSVNPYPNFELYKIILGDRAEEEEYKKIYNRYAHISLEFTTEENEIKLIAEDAILIKINPNTIKELGVKYIIEGLELEEFNTQDVKFEKIYDEYGLFIYKVNY